MGYIYKLVLLFICNRASRMRDEFVDDRVDLVWDSLCVS